MFLPGRGRAEGQGRRGSGKAEKDGIDIGGWLGEKFPRCFSFRVEL